MQFFVSSSKKYSFSGKIPRMDEIFFPENMVFKDGLLDSFDIVSLVSILEETYKIKIDGLDIVPENSFKIHCFSNRYRRP